jgi:imidazolonepropionase-like amidohydrolase
MPKLVIHGGTVLDGRGGMMADGLVEILADGKIGYVGPASGYTIQAGAPELDAGGGFILPGVINAHVHNTESASERPAFLFDGVASTCNTAHPLVNMGAFPDPYGAGLSGQGRPFNSGPFIVAPPDGYPSTVFGSHLVIQVSGEAAARAAVDQLVDAGADYVKVSLEADWDGSGDPPFALLSASELAAIGDQAVARGVTMKAHVSDGDKVAIAIASGVRSFEHTPQFPGVDIGAAGSLAFIFSEDPNGPAIAGLAEMRAALDQMAAAGVVMVPTATMMNIAVPWDRTLDSGGTVSVYEEVVKYFHQVGGRVALGTDYPLDPGEHGMPVLELQALRRALGTEMDVIVAATYNAAFACGQEAMIGSLETGKMGDVITLASNPLLNITAMAGVQHVVLGGEVVK